MMIKKSLPFFLAFAVAVVLSGFLLSQQDDLKPLKIGEKAPKTDLKMEGISGEKHSLSILKAENGLLVIFIGNTCPFVHAWGDRIKEMAHYAGENQVGYVLLNSNSAFRKGDDSMESMKEFALSRELKVTYLIDKESEIANAFGARVTPQAYLFDKDFNLVYEGAIDDNHRTSSEAKNHYLANAISMLVAGEDPDPADTDAIGCSIKRTSL